ncbi:sugar phosphate isomerase/epimerase [Candidatus Poribacteria bacterium]|nr:sugar phosphate isomerase/epimerase [Candidatus Poribacteria bacterium]
MKLGLCTIAFRERSLEEVMSIAADYGFDGIEIWGQEPHLSAIYDEAAVKKVKDMALRKGLEISALGSYINPLMPAFKIAQGLGTNLVRVWSGGGPSKAISYEDKRLITFRFVSLAQWAQFRRITLGLEMHNNNLTDSVASILELITQVKLPSLKTYYQPLFRQNADDPYEAVQKLALHIVNVHAQNADASGKGCPIADGVLDYSKIIEILSSHGYNGYIEVEFVYGDDKLATLQRERDYLASLIGTPYASSLSHITADSV